MFLLSCQDSIRLTWLELVTPLAILPCVSIGRMIIALFGVLWGKLQIRLVPRLIDCLNKHKRWEALISHLK